MADAGEKEFVKKREIEPISGICFLVLAIACVVVIGMYVSDHYFSDDDETVEYGDSISVEYVGSLYDYYNTSDNSVVPVIFDTNISKVGTSDKYTFVADFDSTKTFSSYDVTIGSGKNVGTFEDQLIGAKVGDTVKVYIEAGTGYPVTGSNIKGDGLTTFGIDLSEKMTESEFTSIFGDIELTEGYLTTFEYKINDTDTISGTAMLSAGLVTVVLTVEDDATFVVSETSCGKVTMKYNGGSWYLSGISDTIATDDGIEMVSFSFLGQDYNIVSYTDAGNFEYNQRTGTALLGGQALYFVVKILSID